MKLFWGLVLISTTAVAEIPQGLLSLERIKEEIQAPLINKLLQMKQNFQEIARDDVTYYVSDKIETCQTGNTVNPGQPLMRVVNESQLLPFKRTITSVYGCSQSLIYREFEIQDKNLYRYEIQDPKLNAVFALNQVTENNEIRSDLNLTGQTLYQILQIPRSGYREIFYARQPLRIRFNLNGFNINFNDPRPDGGKYLVRDFGDGRLEFFTPNGQRTSKATFIQNTSFRAINFFVDALIQDLPATKFIALSNRNQKLLIELRNAQTFLISDTNIDYVKNLINEYIKLAEESLLLDNR